MKSARIGAARRLKKSRPFRPTVTTDPRLATVFANENLRRTDNVRIESAAESAVGRNDDEQNPFLRSNFEKRM